MMRLLLLGLIAWQALAQSQLYIDISDRWSFQGRRGKGTVNIGVASSAPLAPTNVADTLQRRVELSGWADRRQLALTLGPVRQGYTVSDGVVEAANLKGELFGFERTAALSTRSAQAIAEAAQASGQNDDIAVVTVRRNG